MTKKILLCALALAGVCGANATGTAAIAASASDSENFAGIPWKDYNPSWGQNVEKQIIISKYDDLIREVAEARGYDWRLIAAIAFAESRFDSGAVSGAGAVGLMQVMPSVARGFRVAREEMTDPRTNVRMGVGLLEQISKTLRFPRSVSERDRLSIMLASYNCGVGRVLDARRLAAKAGEDHNSWEVVAKYLRLLSNPEFYGDPVVRVGAFHDNAQTLGFVKKVMRTYDSYCSTFS